jgi:hypothetical protein
MTDREWMESTDLQAMLSFLQASGRASDGKLRLFAVACCRAVASCLPPDPCWAAVEASERFADGLIGQRDLKLYRADVADVAVRRQAKASDAFSAALHVASAHFLGGQAARLVARSTQYLVIEEEVADSFATDRWGALPLRSANMRALPGKGCTPGSAPCSGTSSDPTHSDQCPWNRHGGRRR